jgi:hypothetical protein
MYCWRTTDVPITSAALLQDPLQYLELWPAGNSLHRSHKAANPSETAVLGTSQERCNA